MGSADDNWVRAKSARPSIAETNICYRVKGVINNTLAMVFVATKGCWRTGVNLQ